MDRAGQRYWAALAQTGFPVVRADETIGVVGALPNKLPLGSGGDDSWNPGDGDLLFGRGLREGSSSPLLRDGDPAKNKSRSKEPARDRAQFQFHKFSKFFGPQPGKNRAAV